MNKAKEISALWSQIKPQIGELVRLCHEVESHAEVTADAYQRGYETGYKDGYNEPGKNQQKAYQRGLSDAWEAARKIWEYDTTTLREIFGEGIMRMDWFMKFTASEAIEKIWQYEQKQEINVGDEVIAKFSGIKYVIVKVEGSRLIGFSVGRTTCDIDAQFVEKTGRHFPEIAEVLQSMKESDNG